MGSGTDGGSRGVVAALRSWRTAAVVLLSFSSGLPLGLVWIAIPDWMRSIGMDIRLVGLITLAQAPWSFKVLWAPLLDRYVPPWLGRRRGWMAVAQVALLALGLVLAGVGGHPDTPWVVGALALAIAFAAATQDIAIDAYAVEVLRTDEQGVAVGARTAFYRAAMFVAGGASITLAGRFSWPLVNLGLALLYAPMLLVTWRAPEPPDQPARPGTLREAVWQPLVQLLARPRALEILAFVVFYKLADNLAGALIRPFLVDMGYSDTDRGVALATIGLAATLLGTFIGGLVTTAAGLGHSLWGFGFLQVFSNLGYVLVAGSPVNRPLMYGATGFESFTSGLGTGAFAVLLLRLTEKRFSATQYALFTSLFGLPRLIAGPACGFLVAAFGWANFFWITIAAGLPGLVLLSRFVPLGVREPALGMEPGGPDGGAEPDAPPFRVDPGAVTHSLIVVDDMTLGEDELLAVQAALLERLDPELVGELRRRGAVPQRSCVFASRLESALPVILDDLGLAGTHSALVRTPVVRLTEDTEQRILLVWLFRDTDPRVIFAGEAGTSVA